MKMSSIDLQQMLLNSRNVNTKKTNYKENTGFQKIIDKIDKTSKDTSNSNNVYTDSKDEKVNSVEEKLSNIDNEEMPVQEELSNKKQEEESVQAVIDISMLMKLIFTDNSIKENKQESFNVNAISKTESDGNIQQIVNLLSNITNTDESKNLLKLLEENGVSKLSVDNFKLLLKENTSLTEANISELLTAVTELNSESLVEKQQLVKEPKVDLFMSKETVINRDSVGNKESTQNNILVNGVSLEDASNDQSLASDSNNSSTGGAETKEDKILKGIINSDSKNENKVFTFANHLNRLREDSIPVQNNPDSMVVNKNNLVNDVVKVVKNMNINNLQELTIRVTPQDLGEVTIKVTMEGNLLKANISASSKETYNLLNSNMVDLKNSLNNSEIKVQEVSINIYNEDSTFFSGNFERSGQQSKEQSGRGNRQNISFNGDEIELSEAKEALFDSDNNLSVLA